MKKINREEFEKMSVSRPGARHPVSNEIEGLLPGEILYIPGSDWKDRSRSPKYLVERAAKATGRKFNFFKQTDVRAWVVERVE